jgi:hypothetical protein
MQVQVTRSRSAPQVLVAAADGEIDIERRDVDREYAQRVIDVEHQLARQRDVRRDDVGQVVQPLPGCEHHLRDYDEVGARADGATISAVSKRTVGTRFDQRERDTAAARVFAEDHVQRIEFARPSPPRGESSRTC